MKTKALIALLCILLTPQIAPAQTCNLKISESPIVRGVKLGMSVKEVANAVPALSITRKDDFGHQIGVYSPIAQGASASLEGVDALTVQWLDDKVISVHVQYDDSTKWDSVNSFSRRIGERLELPAAWEFEADYKGAMHCVGFDVTTRLLASAELTIKQTGAEKIILDRKKEVDENRRKAFKP